MKYLALISILLVSLLSASASSKKLTVDQLKEKLISLQQAKKTDAEVATQLKTVELSEQLTHSAALTLNSYLPGPDSAVEIEILQGRTALLPPPSSDLPQDAAPDLAAQKALLAKTVDYVMKIYMQSPHLETSKTTYRFQDGLEYIRTNSGVMNGSGDNNPSWHKPDPFMHFLGSHTGTVESDKGIEKPPSVKNKAPWSQNGQTSEGGPGPVLSMILQDAAAGGKLQWLHWEMLDGKKTAVFSFAVDRKKSHYTVDYCCFPVRSQTGALYYVPEANMQTGVDWKAFKANVGYHGRFFIDPESGTVVRLITQAELKPTDAVHQEDMRIDYGATTVGTDTLMLPVSTFTLTEVVPNGDDSGATYSIRHTLYRATYLDYHPADTRPAAGK